MAGLEKQKVEQFGACILIACCIVPFTIQCTFMGLYWSLWSDAMEFNEEFKTDGVSNPYDQCGIMKEDGFGNLRAGDT